MTRTIAPHRQFVFRLLSLFLLVAGVAACGGPTSKRPSTPTAEPNTSITPVTSSDIDRTILTVLQNIKQNGFDPAANNGQGGLWIDWRYGGNPLQANGGKCTLAQGQPSCQGKPGHDRLTDLRYLHVLLWYHDVYPTDTQFQSEIQRYTPIVKTEWSTCTDVRGWIYDEWIDMYALSKDPFYKQCAYTIASYYFTQWYHPTAGALYQTSSSSPNGMYRTEDAIGMGAALIEAGVYFNQSQWTQAGRSALAYLKTHAYLPQYHLYLHLLDNVVLPDGTVNPDPTIFKTDTLDSSGSDSSNAGGANSPVANGGNVKAGSIGTEAFEFLRAYQASHDQQYLSDAVDLLTTLSPSNTALGLWDPTHLGYLYGVLFNGPDYQHPGAPTVHKSNEKEAGRQLNVLRAVYLADTLTGGQFKDLETVMLEVAVEKAYYAPGHGYLYSTDANWQPHLRNGQTKDFVTTEAMGIALEALLSVKAEPPSP